MFTAALKAELELLGDVTYCLDGPRLLDSEYDVLWEMADAAITGWGVRPPNADRLIGAPLKVISHTAGSVRVFPRELIERGVIITTARAAIARTVAEYCLLSAMVGLRRFPPLAAPFKPQSETLFGKVVGLVGYGCVGRAFRELLRPFRCPVQVYDPFLSEETCEREEIEQVDLFDLFASSNVVSLHAPDVPETRGMIGRRELFNMPHGAVFINSARGRLVETDALTEAASMQPIYVMLDVTDPEPLPADHALRNLSNVIITPHVAGPTEDDLPNLTRMALDDLKAVLSGHEPRYPISLEAYDRMSF
jgi:phosphoglycerate dehydrogenase-like enzyme